MEATETLVSAEELETHVTETISPPMYLPTPSIEPRMSNRLGVVQAAATQAVTDIEQEEPTSYQEALPHENASKWKEEMHEELTSLRDNKTLDYTPEAGKAIDCKLVYKTKTNHDRTK